MSLVTRSAVKRAQEEQSNEGERRRDWFWHGGDRQADGAQCSRQTLAEIVSPDDEVGGVHDAVTVAVSFRVRRAEVALPDGVVAGVDSAVVIVVAGERVGPERQEKLRTRIGAALFRGELH